MNKLRQYLNRPYFIYEKPWHIVGICALSVAFILAVFEPFNYRLNSIPQFGVLIHFVIITSLGTCIPFIIFPKIFKRFYNPATWTIGKSLMNYGIMLSLIGLFIIIYDMIILPELIIDHSISTFLREGWERIMLINLFATVTIGTIPIVIITILTRNSILKQHLKEAILLNKTLSERIKPEAENADAIILTGATKESVKVPSENLYYMEASGNYVDVYYDDNNSIRHKLLRATIKQIEEQLIGHPKFVRCHRAYIVNTNRIIHISGNAQGYKLILQGNTKEVPVSRTYVQNLKETIV